MASASRVFSPPESVPARWSTVSPEKRNAPRIRRSSRVGAVRRRRPHVLQQRPVHVQRLVLLGVVAEPQPVPGLHLAGVGRLGAGQHPQQRRLPGAVEPEDDDPRTPVDGQVDVGEDLQRPVGLRQPLGGQRRPPARRRRREAHLGDLVLHADVGQPGGQPLGPPGHVLGGLRLGRLRPHLVGLGDQRAGLPLGVGPLLLAAPLVGLALLQVALPADVVDVDLGAVGVEVPHLVDDGLEQLDVVADHDQAAVVARQEAAQPGDRVGVEVVGRLVEQQGLGVGEQDPGQLDAAALTAGEGAQRLGQHPVGQARGWRRSARPRSRPRSRRGAANWSSSRP